MNEVSQQRLRVLALEPYFGGSHEAFLSEVATLSGHQWRLLTGAARHWKWRMRSAPLRLARQTIESIQKHGVPDVVFCSDMLDLPTWLGMLASETRRLGLAPVAFPIAVYFHENQWTYPKSPKAREDFHYGYTNLLTGLAADWCLFNSQFHLDDFLRASKQFLSRMPDSMNDHELDAMQNRTSVIPPGFSPIKTPKVQIRRRTNEPLRIGWVSRWEYDKRPDQFLALIRRLDARQIDFQLVLLGQRHAGCPELDQICFEFSNRILIHEFAIDRVDYERSLTEMDVVFSCADHEFFGIAVCEAISAGAAPLLPRRLCYPEVFPNALFYDSIDQAVEQVIRLGDESLRQAVVENSQKDVMEHSFARIVPRLDARLIEVSKVRD